MSKIEKAFDALAEIESTSSTKLKKQIIASDINNNILFDLLYWTYNPFYRYYSNKIEFVDAPDDVINPELYLEHFVKFKQLLGKLNSRYMTGNNAKDMITNFLNGCDWQEQVWYSRVLTRDLRCGVNVDTINNVYGANSIKQFPVALADKMDETIYPRNFCIQDKFDGYRCLTETNKYVTQLSRNGNLLNGYDELQYIFDKCFANGYMYDGELLSSNFKGTQNTAFALGRNKFANYHIFDVIPIKDFYAENGGRPLHERQMELEDIMRFAERKADKLLGINLGCIIKVENLMEYRTPDYLKEVPQKAIDQADKIFHDAVARGLEGTVIKDLDSKYMVGKSYSSECIGQRGGKKWYSWQKRKPRDLLDLKVLNVLEGTGQFENMLGSVEVDYIGSDGKHYVVGVGSGFNKPDRQKYWNNPNLIIGKTIKVATDGETFDAQGNFSLRFTSFKGVRSDK